jgi:hypothetical protein
VDRPQPLAGGIPLSGETGVRQAASTAALILNQNRWPGTYFATSLEDKCVVGTFEQTALPLGTGVPGGGRRGGRMGPDLTRMTFRTGAWSLRYATGEPTARPGSFKSCGIWIDAPAQESDGYRGSDR